jgi:hypothetical protein
MFSKTKKKNIFYKRGSKCNLYKRNTSQKSLTVEGIGVTMGLGIFLKKIDIRAFLLKKISLHLGGKMYNKHMP